MVNTALLMTNMERYFEEQAIIQIILTISQLFLGSM